MISQESFLENIAKLFPHDLKEDQYRSLIRLHSFLYEMPERAFILLGYAGTGKTTLMGALIRWFHRRKTKTVLLAPTGRSAKVLSKHAGYPASTIHRRIYAVKQNNNGRFSLTLRQNTSENTVFIVDEASMIGGVPKTGNWRGRSLLEDLLSYVKEGKGCKVIFVGDDAQLPPIGSDLSPALNHDELALMLNGNVQTAQLTAVVRQEQKSMVLSNATMIRNQIGEGKFSSLTMEIASHSELQNIESYDLEDELAKFFGGQESDETVILCRSNAQANKFNQQIRSRIFYREAVLEAGDRLMVVKNNYFWDLPGKRQNFLANGDMVVVERVHGTEEVGAFKFADVQVHFLDDSDLSFDVTILLNALDFEGPSIPVKELDALKAELFKQEVFDIDNSEKYYQSRYYNAVQVKHAYAVTCHKAQGGQWNNVFIYQGYFVPDMMDKSYFRWLYTALTRSSSSVYLVNFPDYLITKA